MTEIEATEAAIDTFLALQPRRDFSMIILRQ